MVPGSWSLLHCGGLQDPPNAVESSSEDVVSVSTSVLFAVPGDSNPPLHRLLQIRHHITSERYLISERHEIRKFVAILVSQ